MTQHAHAELKRLAQKLLDLRGYSWATSDYGSGKSAKLDRWIVGSLGNNLWINVNSMRTIFSAYSGTVETYHKDDCQLFLQEARKTLILEELSEI